MNMSNTLLPVNSIISLYNNEFYSLIKSQINDIENIIEYNNDENDNDNNDDNNDVLSETSTLSNSDKSKDILNNYYESLIKCREELNSNILKFNIIYSKSGDDDYNHDVSLSNQIKKQSLIQNHSHSQSHRNENVYKNNKNNNRSHFKDNAKISDYTQKSRINNNEYEEEENIDNCLLENKFKIELNSKGRMTNPVKRITSSNSHFDGRPERRIGDWVCTFCSNHNFSFRKRCNRCNKEREN